MSLLHAKAVYYSEIQFNDCSIIIFRQNGILVRFVVKVFKYTELESLVGFTRIIQGLLILRLQMLSSYIISAVYMGTLVSVT
jgi:hypothetical protein